MRTAASTRDNGVPVLLYMRRTYRECIRNVRLNPSGSYSHDRTMKLLYHDKLKEICAQIRRARAAGEL